MRSGEGLSERTRVSTPIGVWVLCAISIFSAGATWASAQSNAEAQAKAIDAQSVEIKELRETVMAQARELSELSGMLRAYRAWPGEEPKR